MSRPELAALKRGDTLILRGGTPGFRYEVGQSTKVRVVTVGRKYVHVVTADRFDTYDPERDCWNVRKFLLEDQKEDAPGTRIGYSATIATPEQHAYDLRRADARSYLNAQGIQLTSQSPWLDREVDLATLIRKSETED